MAAVPVDVEKATSPWLTVPPKALPGIRKVIGQSDYQAYAGCCTWLNSVYWVRVLKKLSNGNVVIENLHDIGKIKAEPVQAVIEPDLVYTLLRGRDVSRWYAEPSGYLVLTQDPETRRGIPEDEMKRKYPKTYAYLKKFEPELRQRSGYRQYFKPIDPFYSMYNVGPYTMAPIRVFWRQFIPELRMALHLPQRDSFLGSKIALTQHVVSFAPFGSTEEAFFFAGCGNSNPATLLHWNSSTSKSYGQPHILKTIAIPRYSPKDRMHERISDLSARCHAAAAAGDAEPVAALEGEIDKAAAKLWGISDDELKAIQDALREMQKPDCDPPEEAEEGDREEETEQPRPVSE
jgi:hypothetical protein